MKKGQTTIRDIALKLNISISTVSRALRGALDINPATKKAVLEMADKLNYEPNLIAQSLRSNRTNTIGIIVPDVEVHFFSAIVSGIQEIASEANYNVLFCQSNESYETELANIRTLVSSRVDGLIISLSRETQDVSHLLKLQQRNIPVVLYDRVNDDFKTSKVMVNDVDGAYKAVKHLINTGCSKIAFLAGPEKLSISNRRIEGYVKALKEAGMNVDQNLIIHCQSLKDDAVAATEKLLERPNMPDAIFCINDPVAFRAIQVIKTKGLNIPEDISVIGFTNDPISSHIEPSLTTVAQPSRKMGTCAAQLILDELQGRLTVPQTITLDTQLILRNSTR